MAKLFFRYSAMGAGKSLALLSVAHNYETLGQKVAIFTSGLDYRDGKGVVSSRIGVRRAAQTFDEATVFGADAFNGVSCVLVDEAQFCTYSQIQQLHRIAALHSIPVICYGLRTDFRGQPFEGSTALAVLADELEELKTVCACGRKASFNVRVNESGERVTDGPQVQIGGDATYRAVCPACFYR